MKNSSKAEVAVIYGSGLENIIKEPKNISIKTPYGSPSPIFIEEATEEKEVVVFLPRHGISHNVPPHCVNYRANIFALQILGVKRVFATNAVGSINRDLKPGDLVVPHDFVDFTKLRKGTFYDDAPVTHIDMTHPYCPELRDVLIEAAKQTGEDIHGNAVLACTEGPRYETPAEIRMLENLGCDVVGMTGVPEAVLARELEICYASLSYVSNMAVGLQERQKASDLAKIAEERKCVVKQIIKEAIASLPKTRSCICANALSDSWL